MEKLNRVTGKLQSNLDGLSSYIENGTSVAGNITFDIAEACTLRAYIEALESNVKELKDSVIELEKVQNYNQAAKKCKQPEDEKVTDKVPDKVKVTGNMVNHPTHYQSAKVNGKPLECIDIMEAVKGWYKTALFCEMNAFKYNWRLGNKDYIPTELGKIKWYSEKAKSLWGQNLNWFYPKNQHIYAIIEEVRMKDPTTGKWSEGVLYTDGNGTYVRDKVDFMNKFKKA